VNVWSLRMLFAVCVLAVAAGWSQAAPPDSSGPTPVASSSASASPPPDAGQFFTWQQMHTLDPQKQRVATTVRAWEYYVELAARYSGYSDPRWENISTRSFWDIQSMGDGPPGSNRGPVDMR